MTFRDAMTHDLRSVASGRYTHSGKRNAATWRKHFPFVIPARLEPPIRSRTFPDRTLVYHYHATTISCTQQLHATTNSPLPGSSRNTTRTYCPLPGYSRNTTQPNRYNKFTTPRKPTKKHTDKNAPHNVHAAPNKHIPPIRLPYITTTHATTTSPLPGHPPKDTRKKPAPHDVHATQLK
eukprot:22219-Pyramimonas_sp.AAC.1